MKIDLERKVWWPCKFSEPQDDGAVIEHKVRVRFRLPDANKAATDQRPAGEYVGEHIVDWEGFKDAENASLPFTPENLTKALSLTYVVDGLAVALSRCSRGIAEKN